MQAVARQRVRSMVQGGVSRAFMITAGAATMAVGPHGVRALGAQDSPSNLGTYRLTDRDTELLRTLVPVDLRDRKAAPDMEDPAFRRAIGEMQSMQDVAATTKEQIRNGTLDPEVRIRQLVGRVPLPTGVKLDRACTAQLFPAFKAVYLPVAPARTTDAGAGAAAVARRANPQMDDRNLQVLRTTVDYAAAWTTYLAPRFPVVERGITGTTYSRRPDDPLKVTVDVALGLECDPSGKTPAIIGVHVPDGAWLRGTLAEDPLPTRRVPALCGALQRAGITEERYAEILLKAFGARRSATSGGEVDDPPPTLDTPEYKAIREAERANLRWWARHAATLESLLAELESIRPMNEESR